MIYKPKIALCFSKKDWLYNQLKLDKEIDTYVRMC